MFFLKQAGKFFKTIPGKVVCDNDNTQRDTKGVRLVPAHKLALT